MARAQRLLSGDPAHDGNRQAAPTSRADPDPGASRRAALPPTDSARAATWRTAPPPPAGSGDAPPADTLRQITLSEMLARRLRAMIVDRKLPPGSRLGTKTELARQYGVSHGTVHAAVRLLEAQGLAQGRPGVGGGVFVIGQPSHLGLASILLTLRESSDQASVRDMLEARAALDVILARRAAEERREADLPALRAALAAMEAAGRQTPLDVGAHMRRDWALHDCIAQAGHNATLLALYRTILGFIDTQVQDVAPKPDRIPALAENLAVHRGIVDSIVAGDPEAATRFAEQHRRRLVPDVQE